jgi:hypothetical protein
MQKANDHRSPILTPPGIKWLFREINGISPEKYSNFFWPPSGSIFNASHETVWRVPPRFSPDNWAFTINPKSKSLIVLFYSRVAQIWPSQSSVCDTLADSQERTMIILAVPGRIWSSQRAPLWTRDILSELWKNPDSSSEICRQRFSLPPSGTASGALVRK